MADRDAAIARWGRCDPPEDREVLRADAIAEEERHLPERRAAILKDTEMDEMDESLKAIEAMRGSV